MKHEPHNTLVASLETTMTHALNPSFNLLP